MTEVHFYKPEVPLSIWSDRVGGRAMTDVASILACYRSGQISEAEMVDICREWPEVEQAMKENMK